ncbi:MAG: hypothetical protein MJK04_17615 [Psychrosphaera sp.]|nr:hypothetical protein [Psychrosphaera sp.]
MRQAKANSKAAQRQIFDVTFGRGRLVVIYSVTIERYYDLMGSLRLSYSE